MKKLLGITLATLCLASIASSAMAALGTIGGPELSNSWYHRFQEDGWYGGKHYTFDHIQVMITSATGTWEDPALRNFDAASWVGSYTSPKLAVADGPEVGYLQWDFFWNETPLTPVKFLYQVWNENNLVGYTSEISWNVGSWSYPQGTWNTDRMDLPEPMSLVLGFMGLSSVAGLSRLRKK